MGGRGAQVPPAGEHENDADKELHRKFTELDAKKFFRVDAHSAPGVAYTVCKVLLLLPLAWFVIHREYRAAALMAAR